MYRNDDKSQSNNTFMSKRNLEENDKNNNNIKRVKKHNIWTPLESNCLPTNSTHTDSQDMNVVMDDTDENAFNDGLDPLIDDYVSQVLDLSQFVTQHKSDISGNHSQHRNCDQNMTSQTTVVKSNEDVVMNTNSVQSHHSSNSSEASEGRLKILESKCNQFHEQSLKLKTQNIKLQHLIQEIEAQSAAKVKQCCSSYESVIKFEKSVTELQSQLILQLQTALKSHAPNAPILQNAAEFLNQRKRAVLTNFSQTKMQEFYAPLSFSSGHASHNIQSPNTPQNTGDILVHETQPLSGSGTTVEGKRPKLSDSFPSQISPTQVMSVDCSGSSLPQPMETNLDPSNEVRVEEADSSQMSQTQTLRYIWNSCRTVLENEYDLDKKRLDVFFFESPKEFDDQWIRDNQEIKDWTNSLNRLSEELALNSTGF